MKPLNYSDPGCNPVSSNCVIWQGPDIPCINLCKGDSISEVINKLAIELCNIMDMMNVTNYDLECLNLSGCGPTNFQQLIQVLINQICVLQASGANTKQISSTASGLVDMASCYYYTNPLGDTVTKVTTEEYAIILGNRICSILTQITTINSTLASYNTRLIALETAPAPTFTIPQVTPNCVLPSFPTDMNIVLDALEDQFCLLKEVTGTPVELTGSINVQSACITNSTDKLGSSGTMGEIPGWVFSPVLVSDTITNLWLTLCDVRAAVRNIQLNCCPTGCDVISISMYIDVVGGNIQLYLTGLPIPPGFIPCGGTNTIFTISDGINSSNVTVDVPANLNGPPLAIPIPGILNPNANLTVTATICFYDPTTGTTCSNCVSYTYINIASCPEDLLLSQDVLNINWSFTPLVTSVYTIELYTVGDVFITSQTFPGTATVAINGTFTTPSYGTYKVRIKFNTPTVTCPFETIELTAPIL